MASKNFGQHFLITFVIIIGTQFVSPTVQFKVDRPSSSSSSSSISGQNYYNNNNYYYRKNLPSNQYTSGGHHNNNRQSAQFSPLDAFNPSPSFSPRAIQDFVANNNNNYKRMDKIAGSDQYSSPSSSSSPIPMTVRKWTKNSGDQKLLTNKFPSSPTSTSIFRETGLNHNFNVHYHNNNDQKMPMNYYNNHGAVKTPIISSKTSSAAVEALDSENHQEGSKLNFGALAKALSMNLNPATMKKVIRSVDQSVPKNVLTIFKQFVAAGNRVVEFWDEKHEAMDRNGVSRDASGGSPAGTFEMLTYGLSQLRKLQLGRHFDTPVDRVSDTTPPSQALIQGLLMVKKLSQRVWSQDEVDDDDDDGHEIHK